MLFLIKCSQCTCLFALAWLHGLRVSVCLREACLCLLFAPDQSPKTDKAWMLFCYEYFTLRLVSRFPPTVFRCLALVRRHSGRHWRKHFFRQQRPQQFKRISHQELSVRHAIPPPCLCHCCFYWCSVCLHGFHQALTKPRSTDTDEYHYNPRQRHIIKNSKKKNNNLWKISLS